MSNISIRGASANNLSELSLEIPRAKLVSIVGVSGAGKSTLLREIIFGEWQSRISAKRSVAESVIGLPPVVYLGNSERKGGLADLLSECGARVFLEYLFRKEGVPHCLQCGGRVISFSQPELIKLLQGKEGLVLIGASVLSEQLSSLPSFSRIIVDGEAQKISEIEDLPASVILLVDAIQLKPGKISSRLVESLRIASELSPQSIYIQNDVGLQEFSLAPRCKRCGIDYEKLSSQMLRRRDRKYRCQHCLGRGQRSGLECLECRGTGIGAFAGSVRLGESEITLNELLTTPIAKLVSLLESLTFSSELSIKALRGLILRCAKLNSLELGYISLTRLIKSLSGGEYQRVRLARVLSNEISGVLIALDEPTTGLHPKNSGALIAELRKQVDSGNTIVCVTHDRSLIAASDWVIELARHGKQGVLEYLGVPRSESAEPPAAKLLRRSRGSISLKDLRFRNLKSLSVVIPLAELTVVSGISGSGKSTLVFFALKELFRKLKNEGKQSNNETITELGSLELEGNLTKLITFDAFKSVKHRRRVLERLGILKALKELYAKTEIAQVLGLKERDFAVAANDQRIEAVKFKGRSFAEIYALSITEALILFKNIPALKRPLDYAAKLGLGYLKLDQREISEGEEKRVSLSRIFQELKSIGGGALLLLDEPTQGLHPTEEKLLIEVLNQIVEAGNTVIAIDHSERLQAAADFRIEMGPGSGEQGGEICSAEMLK